MTAPEGGMGFQTEPEPARGTVLPVLPGIGRLVAPNPGPMTYWGTNTYLVETEAGTLVVDPGPDDPAHVDSILRAAGAVAGIVLTHGHSDHFGGLPALKARTGAPTYAWHLPSQPGFVPDMPLRDGDRVGGWEALHTPGHASDHLCFAGPNGVLLSADHVMGWSSSVIPPPDGNMADYLRSLRRLLARAENTYLPGHGPIVTEPHRLMRALLAHREMREAAVLRALGPVPQTPGALVARLYKDIAPPLARAAERSVLAHLGKLAEEGRAREGAGGWVLAA